MNQKELEDRIKKLMHIVLPQMRSRGVVLQKEFNELLDCMEQLTKLSKDQEVISKRLAFNLFFFYTKVNMTFEYYITDEEAKGDLLVRLYEQTMNLLSGGSYLEL
ncbi:hypothetical protein [Paenibacillus terrae]|uniref:hypothetical protein n=1 Tax=Paenibacillus terrae TaxID=159743 RepID=UPI0011EB812B|nr:hypothetical protein [Paenibacillus terrae]